MTRLAHRRPDRGEPADRCVRARRVPPSAHVTVSAPGATRGGSDQEITFRVPVEKDVNTVGADRAAADPHPDRVRRRGADRGLDAHRGDVQARHGDRDRRRGHHVRRLADHLEGHRRRTEAGGVRRLHDHRRPAAGRQVSWCSARCRTYSDGSVVRWIQTAAPGSSDEPDFPAAHSRARCRASSSVPDPVGTDSVGESSDAASSTFGLLEQHRTRWCSRSSRWSSPPAALGVVRGVAGAPPGQRRDEAASWPRSCSSCSVRRGWCAGRSAAAHGEPPRRLQGQLTVGGAYVVAPVPPTKLAAAYFTDHELDRSSRTRLLGVQTGAGSRAALHLRSVGGTMSRAGRTR